MSLHPNRYILIVIFLIITLFSFSQSNSPYSRFGLGNIQPTSFADIDAMGSLSMGIASPRNINFTNPASYAAINAWTILEIGVSSKGSVLRTDSLTQDHFNSSLSYLSFAFPISKKWGSSIGLLPYSKMNYDIVDTRQETGVGEFTNEYEGKGGLYRFYLGNGFQILPFKDSSKHALSIGANISFLFGTMSQRISTEFPDTSGNFNLRKTQDVNVKDFLIDFGLQYYKKFKKDIYLTLGLKTGLGTILNTNAKRDVLWERYTINSYGFTDIEDTISQINEERNTVKIPLNLGGGFVLAKKLGNMDKWLIGMDIHYSDWSKYRSFGEPESFTNNYRISLGGQIIPDPKAVNNYWKNISYKAGAFYGTSYLKINNTEFNEFGITFGLGLPLRRYSSYINLAVELGKMGTTENDLVEEQYIKVKLGFTFNSIWFQKRKFD